MFDDGPTVPHVRTVAPWEVRSNTSQENREEEEMHRAARLVKVKALWAAPSECDLDAQFERELAAQEYKMATPWDEVRPGDNTAKIQAEAKALRDRQQNYKYQAIWAAPEMSAERLEQLACYQMSAPFEREGDVPYKDPVFEAKKEKLAATPRTLAPWKYGLEPSNVQPREVKAWAKKDTSLWANTEAPKANSAAGGVAALPPSGDPVLDACREKLLARAKNVQGLAKRFKIMDDDRSGTLDFNEFRKGIKECQVGITDMQIKHLFHIFDKNDNGSVSYEEFIVGLRGALNPRREAIVRAAFTVMDRDGNGYVDMSDIRQCYNARSHPDVVMKIRSEEAVLRELLESFEGGLADMPPSSSSSSSSRSAPAPSTAASRSSKGSGGSGNVKGDGIVTRDEFCSYYATISASIDDDDYFELMIRNAWRISGGVGWAANSANARMLVTHADGSQTVEEVRGALNNDYSRSYGAAGDAAANNTKGRQLNRMTSDNDYKSAAPTAGVSSAALNNRSTSASASPRPSSAAVVGGQYGMTAGPGANDPVKPHVNAKAQGGPGTGYIRGLPDQAGWATNPAAAAVISGRVLQELKLNPQAPAPTSLAAAILNKMPNQGHGQGESASMPSQSYGRRAAPAPPPKANPSAAAAAAIALQTNKNMQPTYSAEQLAAAAAKQRVGGAAGGPKSLRDQLLG